MKAVTRPSDTDAPARLAAPGALLLRAILAVGFVVGALLLVVGLPGGVDARVSRDRPALTSAPVAMTGSDAIRAPEQAASSPLAEVDGWAGEASSVDPLSNLPPRLSATGLRPHGHAVAPPWDSMPPDRPPRHA